ncbi:C40 family peptidase [Streptomyces flavidovirens]|uniref:C40 family peptidase n=1 Tax=Streptomyces flavidovirens TaxID=67298 RepID=UPI00369D71D6
MSLTAHIPSHRKPRRSASKVALRAGVAGGVLSTIGVAGAAGPANAEPVTATIEMPTITADLANTVAVSAEATQQVAHAYDLQAQQDEAAAKAAKAAKKDKAEAERKAEAEAKRKAEEAAKKKAAQEAAEKAAAEERASRSSERTTLSASASVGSSSSSASSPVATGSAAAVVAFARAQVGDAYVMGSTGPNSWDCSGLVQAAFRQAGIDLPRVSGAQSSLGTSVSVDSLQPGDILYWGSRSNSYHVAVYVGDGKYVGAQNPSTGVVERSLSYDMPTGAVRVL